MTHTGDSVERSYNGEGLTGRVRPAPAEYLDLPGHAWWPLDPGALFNLLIADPFVFDPHVVVVSRPCLARLSLSSWRFRSSTSRASASRRSCATRAWRRMSLLRICDATASCGPVCVWPVG